MADPFYPGFDIERRDAVRVKKGDIIHFTNYGSLDPGLFRVQDMERKGASMIYYTEDNVSFPPRVYKRRQVKKVTDKVNVYTPQSGTFKPGTQLQGPERPPLDFGGLFE